MPLGDKFYALLQGDKIKLFDSKINAFGYFTNMKYEAVGLSQVYTIYRNYSETHDMAVDYSK
jgi:hypothetical protein